MSPSVSPSASVSPSPAAAPSASAEEVAGKIEELYRQAGSAGGRDSPAGYTAAGEETAAQRGRVAAVRQDDVVKRTDMLSRAREMLQAVAGTQARTGSAASDATALLADAPQGYFDRAQLMSRLTARQKGLVARSSTQRPATGVRRRETGGSAGPGEWPGEVPTLQSAGQAAGARRDVRAAKAAVRQRLADARALLSAAATASERTGTGEPAAEPATGAVTRGEARKALAFARAQIGKPYVRGAAGPGSYDSSGLAQAAWKAAGVALPRALHDQAGAGRTIPLSEALPGDLVFFHEARRHGSHEESQDVHGGHGVHGEAGHVGVYAGDGMMVHAPKPGAHVREESIFHTGASVIQSVVRPA
ncbi:C40 family peptidase [Streptomyces carpinensis]|nr:C40 family peptidase [Streptomyces carpinensis]